MIVVTIVAMGVLNIIFGHLHLKDFFDLLFLFVYFNFFIFFLFLEDLD